MPGDDGRELASRFEDEWRDKLVKFCFDYIFKTYGKPGPRNKKRRDAALDLAQKIYHDFERL